MPHTAFIGVGSNLGDPLEQCRTVVSRIESYPSITLFKQSSFYKTEPFGKSDQGWFINLVIQVQTQLSAGELLNVFLNMETGMGRERKGKWGPRVIDLDILFYDSAVINETGLHIPHPGLAQRRFVLEPLNELAPDLIHPLLNKPVGTLLSELQDDLKVERLDSSL